MQATTQAATAPRHANAANTLATFKVIPTGAAVGAEIQGMDLSLPIPDDVGTALRDAWAKHMVIFWRGQTINDDQLMECPVYSARRTPPRRASITCRTASRSTTNT